MKHSFATFLGAALTIGVANADRPETMHIGTHWTIGCYGGEANALGELNAPAHCRIEAEGLRVAMIVIDHSGTHLRLTPGIAPCPETPSRAAVDGRPINGLGIKRQLKALLSGRVYAVSDQTSWPSCFPQIMETSLESFGLAFAAMNKAWAEYRVTHPK